MADQYLAYLNLLDTLREKLSTLSDLARQKTDAVTADNLTALDAVMRQEQALSLAFRGFEQKKDALSAALGLDGVSLSALPEHYPESLRLRAKETVEALQNQVRVYSAASEVARSTLECNLHEIEKFLAAQEGGPVSGPGYTPPPAQPPENMKSDFRA